MLEDTDTRLAVHEAVCAERDTAIGPGFAGELVKKILGL